VFCAALHDQLASLCRYAQLTHCFSAVAELLVLTFNSPAFLRYCGAVFSVFHYVVAELFIYTHAADLFELQCISMMHSVRNLRVTRYTFVIKPSSLYAFSLLGERYIVGVLTSIL